MKILYLILIVFGLSHISIIAQTGWNVIGNAGDFGPINSIKFDNINKGIVVGPFGAIRKTEDGGSTWYDLQSGVETDLYSIAIIGSGNYCVVGDSGTVLRTYDAGNNWSKIYSGTDSLLRSVDFVDANNGWVVGDGGTILKTTNGGTSWEQQTSNTIVNLTSVDFVDANNGWAAGWEGVVCKTTNGGSTWSIFSFDPYYDFFSIAFTTPDKGWVLNSSKAIFYTEDGGINWTQQTSNANLNRLVSICFIDSVGWAVGHYGTIINTTNGGKDWNQQFFSGPPTVFLFSVTFIDKNNGWILGDGRIILQTSDGGGIKSSQSYSNNSLSLPIPDVGEVNDIIEVQILQKKLEEYTISGITIIIDSVLHTEVSDLTFLLTHNSVTDTLIVQNEIAGNNILNCKLTDVSAENISEAEAPYLGSYKPYNPLSVFSGLNPNGQWTLRVIDNVSGNTGVLQSWGLKIYYDAVTEVKSDYTIIPEKYKVYQNYPNPFNPSTTISWQSPIGGWQTIKLFDVLGREVETIDEGYYDAGIHSTFYIVNSLLPSGVYFYQLKAGDFIQTKKMILLK